VSENIGYATLSVIPSALGFGSALSKGIAPEMAAAGASGGAGLLGAIKKALPVAAVMAAVGTLAAIGNTFHDMEATIRVGTGATGAALDALVASAKNVGKGTAASFEDVGKTVTALNVRLGLTGPVLETLSKQFLAAGRITKQALDLNTITGSFNAFGISSADMSGALDQLFQISQATGMGINELAAAATKGAPAFRQFGLSFGDSAALVGVLDKAGINSGKTIMALTIGLTKFAKEGKAPGPALRETVKSIEAFTKSGEDAKAIALAAGIFGTRGAAQFVAAVKSGKVNLDDMMKSSGASGDSIMAAADAVSGLSGKWSKFMNNVLVAVEPIATRVFNALNNGMKFLLDVGLPAMQAFGAAVSDKVGPALSAVGSFITGTALPAIQGFIQGFKDGTGAGGGFKDFLVLLYNDAVKPIGDFLTNTAIPAIKDFVKGFQDGTGPGGEFKGILKDIYDNGIVPLATFITGTALPALKSIETWITGTGGTSMGSLKQWFDDNAKALGAVAIVITTVLLPVFADMAVKAVASAVTQVGAWVSTQVAAVTSATAQFAAHYTVVAGWIASAASAVASGATTVAIWAMIKWEAISSAAAQVAAWVSTRVAAIPSALITTGALMGIAGWWVSSAVAAVASGVSTAATWVAMEARSIAGAAIAVGSLIAVGAGWVTSAVIATASGIAMAAAWVVGLGPIAWIIAAVVAIGAALVLAYQKVDWFRTAVDATWTWIKMAASAVGDWFTVTIPAWWQSVLDSTVRIWGNVTGFFAGMWASITGFFSTAWAFIQTVFGWSPLGLITSNWDSIVGFFSGLPDRIGSAVSGMWDGIKDSLKTVLNWVISKWNDTIGSLHFNIPDWVPGIGGKGFDFPKIPALAQGGIVPATPGGRLVRVAEAGIPEAVIPLDGRHSVPGVGGAQIIQNVYPTPGLSEQQVGAYAASQLAWAMRGQLA